MPHQFAGFWPRVGAFLLDYLVIAAYVVVMSLGVALLSGLGLYRVLAALTGNPWLFDLFAFLILVLPVILYFTFSEASARHATWGKQRLKLAVVSVDGKPVGWWRAFARSAVKFLPWQIAHSSVFHIPGWPAQVQAVPAGSVAGFTVVWILVGLYLLALIFSKTHRTPYDWVARTAVVPAGKSPRR